MNSKLNNSLFIPKKSWNVFYEDLAAILFLYKFYLQSLFN